MLPMAVANLAGSAIRPPFRSSAHDCIPRAAFFLINAIPLRLQMVKFSIPVFSTISRIFNYSKHNKK